MKILRIITLSLQGRRWLEYHFKPFHHKMAALAHLTTGLNIDYAANQRDDVLFKIKWNIYHTLSNRSYKRQSLLMCPREFACV